MTCFEIREVWSFRGCPTDCPMLQEPAARSSCTGMKRHNSEAIEKSPPARLGFGRERPTTLDDLDRRKDAGGSYQAYWGQYWGE